MRQIDKKCHNDDADDNEDYDVSKNDDDEELMMMMVVMIKNKDKLRSDSEVADWPQFCGVGSDADYDNDDNDDDDDDDTVICLFGPKMWLFR